MIVVLCALNDDEALSFARRAQADGIRCEVLTGEALSFARRRSHRLSTNHDGFGAAATSTIDVPGMPQLRHDQIHGVLNRLTESPAAAWHYADPVEQSYAVAEMHAFVLSWLTSLRCPVRNRPSGESLSGAGHHRIVQLAAAHRAGLNTPAFTLPASPPARNQWVAGSVGEGSAPPQRLPGPEVPIESMSGQLRQAAAAAAGGADIGVRWVSVVCLDGTPLGDGIPMEIALGVERLLADLELTQTLAGLDFAVAGDHWVFAGLTCRPALRSPDGRLYRRLIEVLSPAKVSR